MDESFYESGLGEYVEILIKNKNSKGNYYFEAKEEWGDANVIAHTRGTFILIMNQYLYLKNCKVLLYKKIQLLLKKVLVENIKTNHKNPPKK